MLECPHCESNELTVYSINCTGCGGRVRCPECGSLLKYDDAMEGYAICTACDFRMPSIPIKIGCKVCEEGGSTKMVVPQLPVKPVTEWEEDRWMTANRLLFPRDGDRAVLMFIVTGNDIHFYSARHPEFKHTVGNQLSAISESLRKDYL